MTELDLLSFIEKNAKCTITDLSMALNESEEVITNSLKELEDKKVICGYHTLINWDKSCTEKVHATIQVSCSPEREHGYDRIAKRIYMYNEVESMSLLSGSAAEFIVNVEGKTMQEIAHFVGRKLAPIEGVTGTATLFVLKQYKKNGVILDTDDNYDDNERLLVTP
ncbi:Lrp/AsnC family transcriptional regulator [Tannockella kyphosi]|uniref:Lrp/AsnC family transcriptional regulator n=1 Tax=Tannockella kyphosi TaxID=2899121 RepID=UPI002011518E|nr:Lrp/AsnC family transcriptional regulator [Tannockella kyphosi]